MTVKKEIFLSFNYRGLTAGLSLASGMRTFRAKKRLVRAINAPKRKTYWKPKLFQISPPSRAPEIEKTWSMVMPAVSAGWMSESTLAIFFM
jgi:hypothetical protein